MNTKDEANTEKVRIDIQYSETVNRESILRLSSEIENELSAPVTAHMIHQRSLEIPTTISIVVGTVAWLLHLFGVREYFKTRMHERAKIDAHNANERREQRVQPSHWFVTELSELRHDGVSIYIALHIPPEKFQNHMNSDHFGGLHLKGTTKEMIASELDEFLQYIPALEHLIDTEITPKPILGGVNLKLVENGLEVSWMSQETVRKHTQVLRLDSNS